MTVPVLIDLPNGVTIEVGDPAWELIATANCNRPNGDGYVEWTQSISRNADGELLVYVLMLPPSGIIQTGGIVSSGDGELIDVVERLAKRFDVPSHVPYSCLQRYKRALARLKT